MSTERGPFESSLSFSHVYYTLSLQVLHQEVDVLPKGLQVLLMHHFLLEDREDNVIGHGILVFCP